MVVAQGFRIRGEMYQIIISFHNVFYCTGFQKTIYDYKRTVFLHWTKKIPTILSLIDYDKPNRCLQLLLVELANGGEWYINKVLVTTGFRIM
ncbi:hypothetical protein MTR_4g082280 [Medicago truncatula]|uniref:Uncharacterized protein n=1 Tax=Medicago truncatula TaxID=3880 RepID=A0A072UN36_MEDTR|nr:hypothetical protein MTR_4g082280 [Medicago truncatula]